MLSSRPTYILSTIQNSKYYTKLLDFRIVPLLISVILQGRANMKGVILAGGTGSRLFPLTKITNKHLLPVGRYPMIYHAINKLSQADIRDILIVTGKEHMGDVVNLLGSGREFGVEF